MITDSKREHQIIADFVSARVFPALDEFTSAHRLSLSVESGLLVLIAQRLIYQGFAPADILAAVQQAMDALTVSRNPEKPAEVPQQTTVVKFQRIK